MLRPFRTPLLLLGLLLALLSGSYWLWRALGPLGKAGDAGAPSSASERKALETLTQVAPPAPPASPGQPLTPDGQRPSRENISRESSRSDPSLDSAAAASLAGQVTDAEGRPVPEVQLILARWIEDESAKHERPFPGDSPFADLAHSSAAPRIPARIAVHLPIDVADPAAAGLPVPLRIQPDESGNFRVALAPGRWRMLVRSTLAPFERNDLLLAAGEQRELGRILLRPGITYRFECRDARGAKLPDLRAAPLLSGLGADFPPLAGALALPFLRPPATPDEPWTSLPQRPVPFSLWLCAPHTRALRLALDLSNPKLTLSLPDVDHLYGALQYSEPSSDGAFTIHARPLDFFESPIPSEFRADLAHADEQAHTFDLELPERSTCYELRAAFRDEPALLPSPWSPPRYFSTSASADLRPQHDPLRESLVWRADARIQLEISGRPASHAPVELLLSNVFVRGSTPGQPIRLPEGEHLLSGLRLLRGPEPQLFLRVPGTEVLDQPLSLLAGGKSDLGPLELTALPALDVQVSDARTAQPIPRATIRSFEDIPGAGPSEPTGPLLALADARGAARVFVASLDLSLLEIRAPDYAPAYLTPRDRSPGGVLRARLYRGATVRIRVFDSDAAPLRAALVECTRSDWTPDLGPPTLLDSRATDAKGWATFTHVTPGKHSFRIRSSHKLQPSEWSIVDLADESTRELPLATRTRSRLKVRVLTSSGPRPDALLTLESGSFTTEPPSPLCADDPLPYGIDACTDNRGETFFEDLEPDSARLTLTLPDSALRLRRTLRLRPGPQTFTFDLSDSLPLPLSSSATLPPLELRLLPPPLPLRLDDDPLPLAALDLEHTSRLDRRHARPDLLFPDPAAITLPADLLREPLLLTTSPPSLALTLIPELSTDSTTPPPDLAPTRSLDITLLSLHPGERYVLLLGRTSAPDLHTLLDAHPDLQSQLPAAALDPSDSAPPSLLVERTLPLLATAPTLTFTLSHLLPGETVFRLYRLAPNHTTLLPESPPTSITLSADKPTRLRLTTRN
jgi:hypothetical protein